MTGPPAARGARVLVFDSGLGGLTVYAAIAKIRPDVNLIYAADDAAFPYGALDEPVLVARVTRVVAALVARCAPDLVVIACNTASTLVLGPLRAEFPGIPFVGTVPAIKPAAAASRSRLISVLATPGTVARDYTRSLVRAFAGDCEVALVGSARLAGIAEDGMMGLDIDAVEVAREIAPCFVEKGARRTDQIVLACTHYPLLHDHFIRASPWPVTFVDPAPAIARRVDSLLGQRARPDPGAESAVAHFTGGALPTPALRATLERFGLRVAAKQDAMAFVRA